MKRQVRRNVFETNSSSMHSLTIMKRNNKYSPEEILDGIYLYKDNETNEENCIWEPWTHDLEFGRQPFRALGTFKDKWLYACASLVNDSNDAIYEELVTIALKYVPGLKKIKLPIVVDAIPDKNSKLYKDSEDFKKHGKTEDELIEYLTEKGKDWVIKVEYWNTNGYWHYNKPYTGYVDEDILSGFLKEENVSLEEFLTNKKYIVIQDGDEYCYWKNMKKCGLINMDAIDHEYPAEVFIS